MGSGNLLTEKRTNVKIRRAGDFKYCKMQEDTDGIPDRDMR